MQKFIILKASAGSGKTFNLARKYLEFAFEAPFYFKHILAVTFTNKATTELKNRILKEFNQIASGGKSDHLDYLVETLGKNEEQLQNMAKKILSNILQDFSNFHVYTIDGFFQNILKGFFREIGINTQYNIELSQKQVLDKATDALFFELAETNDPLLISWLTNFSESEVEEGNTWNLKNKIKKLGEELFTETYKSHTPPKEDIAKTLQEISELRKKLVLENKLFWDGIYQQANNILLMVENNGFSMNDFKGKSRSFLSQIHKILKEKSGYDFTGTLGKYVDDVEQVAPKGKEGDVVRAFYDTSLNASLKKLNNSLENDYGKAVRNTLILKNLYSLGVIKYVHGFIKKMNAEQNTLLISDSNELIHKITSGSDAPFIYEKSGNKYFNYMIDEFQDTSRMQWNNIQPLVDNSLAFNKENLIVGDVKQSIYRWRNSDWKMLGGDIQSHYGEAAAAFNLPANYRSKNNIIAFNNAFFHQAKQVFMHEWQREETTFSNLIDAAYNNSYQEFGGNDPGGFVRAKVMEASNKEEFQGQALQHLAQQIDELLEKGYQQSDLVILVRRNTEGAEIINQLPGLMQRQVNFVSEDSYFLNSSFVVQFVISVLQYLLGKSDFQKSQVKYLYAFYIQQATEDENHFLQNLQYLSNILKSRSLINLVHEIIIRFGLMEIENQRVFLLALLDEIRGFQNHNQGGLEELLRYWENNADRLVIKDAQNNNAVRILTIHKSKGLEFKVVLIPFLDWDFDPSSTLSPILWCKNPLDKDSQLQVLPIRFEKKMMPTEFAESYYLEKVQNVIDSLNIIYVAFTRAIDGLYFGLKKAKGNSTTGLSNVSKLFNSIFETDISMPEKGNFAPIHLCYKQEEEEFSFGDILEIPTPLETVSKNILPPDFHLKYSSPQIKVRKNVKHTGLKDDVSLAKTANLSRARLGILLHKVFEDLTESSALPAQIQKLVVNGWISPEQGETIKINVESILAMESAQKWFKKGVETLTEKEIITDAGVLLRPDRVVRYNEKIVVIDYKFGNEKNPKYKWQVKKYIDVLSKIYSEKVEGVVWYVLLGEYEAVNV